MLTKPILIKVPPIDLLRKQALERLTRALEDANASPEYIKSVRLKVKQANRERLQGWLPNTDSRTVYNNTNNFNAIG